MQCGNICVSSVVQATADSTPLMQKAAIGHDPKPVPFTSQFTTISSRSICIFSSHLFLGLPCGRFPRVFRTVAHSHNTHAVCSGVQKPMNETDYFLPSRKRDSLPPHPLYAFLLWCARMGLRSLQPLTKPQTIELFLS